MTYIRVRNKTRNVDLGQKIWIANSLRDRAVGLLSTNALGSGEGLLLSPCKSIHTFFMRFPIDVLFLDPQGIVLAQKTYKPWRLSGWYRKADGVLELSAGTIERTKTQLGDRLDLMDLK